MKNKFPFKILDKTIKPHYLYAKSVAFNPVNNSRKLKN